MAQPALGPLSQQAPLPLLLDGQASRGVEHVVPRPLVGGGAHAVLLEQVGVVPQHVRAVVVGDGVDLPDPAVHVHRHLGEVAQIEGLVLVEVRRHGHDDLVADVVLDLGALGVDDVRQAPGRRRRPRSWSCHRRRTRSPPGTPSVSQGCFSRIAWSARSIRRPLGRARRLHVGGQLDRRPRPLRLLAAAAPGPGAPQAARRAPPVAAPAQATTKRRVTPPRRSPAGPVPLALIGCCSFPGRARPRRVAPRRVPAPPAVPARPRQGCRGARAPRPPRCAGESRRAASTWSPLRYASSSERWRSASSTGFGSRRRV